MAGIDCSVISQKYGQQYDYATDTTAYAGFNYNNEYYPFIIKFKTPKMTEGFISTSIDFNLAIWRGSRNGSESPTVSLRYAILSDDANYRSYLFTKKEVDDENQLVSGITTLSSLPKSSSFPDTKTKLNIPISVLKPDTIYFLILWGDDSGGYAQDYCKVHTSPKHSITMWYYSEFTVTFNANGGTVSPTSKTVIYGSTYGEFPTPSREGHTFTGWYTAPVGGTRIQSTNTVNITADQTLYAQWKVWAYFIGESGLYYACIGDGASGALYVAYIGDENGKPVPFGSIK